MSTFLNLPQTPIKKIVEDKKYITFICEPRREFTNPDNRKDIRLSFEDDRGADLDLGTNGGWVEGKDAVIQSLLMLLGTNQSEWWADKDYGTFLFKYYRDFHKYHGLLQRFIKLEIS